MPVDPARAAPARSVFVDPVDNTCVKLQPLAIAAARLFAKIPECGVASERVIRLVNSTCSPKS